MRIALGIEYDGTGYHGWQRQAAGNTVQDCVETALGAVADHPVAVVCAGRTDTGVHATGQVVHFDSDALRSCENWIRGTNAGLPDAIRVQWAHEVDEDFHARFSALRRRYRYLILNRPTAPALLRRRVCWERLPLDLESMQTAATHLVGEHDFSSFRAAACQARSPLRTIYSLQLARHGDCICMDVEANAFLHHMVRTIAGVLIATGRGEQAPGWVAGLLQARDRTQGGVNAVPCGLYLTGVSYPEQYGLPVSGWLPVFG